MQERIAVAVFYLIAACVVVPTLLLFGYIVLNGIGQINWQFLSQPPNAIDASGGIFPALVGTAYLMVGTVFIALPLGIAGAIYLTEYARPGPILRIVRIAIVNLSGVPSIVHGLFGLGFFVFFVGGSIDRFILHSNTPVWGKPCILWGALTLAIVILPIIITATEEALHAVPASFREASLAVGATKWQTIKRVILPTAAPGILTGAVLGMGRAAGETAPVMLTCAASFMPSLPTGLNDQAMLLPYHLYFVATQVPNPSVKLQAGIALVLILMVLSLTLIASAFRAQARKAHKW